jgi:integration host factor subunit beta
MANLTKAKLKLKIAEAVGVSLKEAREMLDIILDSMVRALRKGERVEVRGFGTLCTHTRKARGGRNPKTGAEVNVPEKRVPRFKPSVELRAMVNGYAERTAESRQDPIPTP